MTENNYIRRVLDKCEAGTTVVSSYVNAREKLTLKCGAGHFRYVSSNDILSRGRGLSCKECLGKTATGKKTEDTIDKEFAAEGLTRLEPYKNALTKIKARNNTCGHEYLVLPSSISRGQNVLCPECNYSRRNYTADKFAAEIKSMGLTAVDAYVNMKTNISVANDLCGHEYLVNPGHLLYDKIGINCPVCSGKDSVKSRFLNLLEAYNLELVDAYAGTQAPVQVKNNTCGHLYQVIPNNLVSAGSGKICRICTPSSSVSASELEVLDFIKANYSGWIETNDRTILAGKELDIVLPDLGIAIEFNGSYWHSEDKLGSKYHLDKTEKVEAVGFRLIHIFDWEWSTKQDIVKSRILAAIGVTKRIPARKTQVRPIPFPGEFLNANHIQGAGTLTKLNYGLFLGDELVAVMTFGKPRFTTAQDYELIRYCSKLGHRVVGGASKLLKHFRSLHTGSLISYCDRRWGLGKMYEAIGFKHTHNSSPNYRYTNAKTTLSRYQCTKHNLRTMFPAIWRETKTEEQIMMEAGWHRVYDSGSSVWVLE